MPRTKTILRSKVKVVLLLLFMIYISWQVSMSTMLLLGQHDNETMTSYSQVTRKPGQQRNQAAPLPDQSAAEAATAAPPPTRSHVIINSYMRSGSSFIGRLLGYHPDSFYVYEPLWKYSIWNFYNAENQTCDSVTCGCRPTQTQKKEQNSMALLDKLRHMVSCESLQHVVVGKMTPFYSGIPWMNFTSCLKRFLPGGKPISNNDVVPLPCILEMQNNCRHYKHVVSKVLRLTADLYEDLLKKTTNTKVIQLFRDPRATLNSRLKTAWFPITNIANAVTNARCLCKRMLDDYRAGIKLQALYPGRFRLVFYEDLETDLNRKTNQLYKFVDIRSIESIGEEIFQSIATFGFKSDHSLRDNSTDYSSWWRRSMKWDMVQAIDKVCSVTYAALGYRQLNSEAELRDLTVPSFNIESQHRLG